MNPCSTFLTKQFKRFKRPVIWSIPLVTLPLVIWLILMKTFSSPSQVVTSLAVPSPQPSSKMPSDNPNTQVRPPKKDLAVAKIKAAIQPQQPTTQNIWSQAFFPVENFQAYSSGFGWRVQEEREEFHAGLDIAAPEGSYIRNWWVGQVITVAEDSFCGNKLVIQSGNWQAFYCHLQGQVGSSPQGNYLMVPESNITIVQGQWVPTGALIGQVGMTGRTTGPHLHWGVKYAGQWVDPALVLQAMYAAKTQENLSGRGKS